ncbi:GLPGLI family protein [Porphyromonas loveana]|uniref:GLPGLI family protein n=1 Tax=Porphyromonas loveana TaxID=1884669 RepID=UPI0035A0EFE0
MKRILLLLVFLLAISSRGWAQMPKIEGLDQMPMDTIVKEVKDYARQRFFYKVSFVEDTEQPEKRTEAQCVLEIGHHGSSFKDFYRLATDSLVDDVVKKNGTFMELFGRVSGWAKNKKWYTALLKGYPAGEDYHQTSVSILFEFVEYSCPSPTFDWQVGEETKEIMGYMCRKATCHHSGRDYTAWYAEEIPLSDGPYIFRGLLGLIVAISSDDGEYTFELNGQQEITFSSPIYLELKKRTYKKTREEARIIIRNMHENCAEIFANTVKIKASNPEFLGKLMDRFRS